MTDLEQRLLNDYQRDFPLSPEPFATLAGDLGCASRDVLAKLAELVDQGKVSRVGPVFQPNRIGASTLAAMAVPEGELEAIAAIVGERPEVNHNYEREHRLNLWFVATAPDQAHLREALHDIERRSGYGVLPLPLVKEYHIDLGFQVHGGPARSYRRKLPASRPVGPVAMDSAPDADLIAAIQLGLPLVERPYRAIGERIGLDEQTVIERIAAMRRAAIIKRLGVIVRHRKLGYRANAMLVWDVPDERVDEIGRTLATVDCVTLCYQRPRRLPDWPYNLFCMIHGKDRREVLSCIDELIDELALNGIAHDVLFSRRCFKQRGAVYRPERRYERDTTG